MYYKEQLCSLQNGLNDMLTDLIRELETLPEGSLFSYQKGGRIYYCRRLPKEGNRKKERREAITKDADTVLALVRKRYVETAVQNIRNDLADIDRAIKNYSPIGEDSIMQPFFTKHPELAEGIYYGRRDPKKWQENYEPPEFYEESLKSVSAQGEKMKS